MKNSTLILIVVSIAVVILIAGLIRIGLMKSSVIVSSETNSAPMVVAEGNPPQETQKVTSTTSAAVITTDGMPTPVTAPTLPEDSPDWDARMQDVLTSEKPDQEIAMSLLGMLSQMPPERLLDTTELIAGLMPNEGYTNLAPLLNQPFLNEDILDALMVDLLDRPEAIQLPLFLQIASNLAHPRNEEALDYLELQLDAEHGTDWGAWEKEIEAYLNDPDPDPDLDLDLEE